MPRRTARDLKLHEDHLWVMKHHPGWTKDDPEFWAYFRGLMRDRLRIYLTEFTRDVFYGATAKQLNMDEDSVIDEEKNTLTLGDLRKHIRTHQENIIEQEKRNTDRQLSGMAALPINQDRTTDSYKAIQYEKAPDSIFWQDLNCKLDVYIHKAMHGNYTCRSISIAVHKNKIDVFVVLK